MISKSKKYILILLLVIFSVISYAVVKDISNDSPYVTLIFYIIIGFSAAVYGSKKLKKEDSVKNKVGSFVLIFISTIGIYLILFSNIKNSLLYGVICVALLIPTFFIFKRTTNK